MSEHLPLNAFRYFKTSPEVIRLAAMMYVRFPLSTPEIPIKSLNTFIFNVFNKILIPQFIPQLLNATPLKYLNL